MVFVVIKYPLYIVKTGVVVIVGTLFCCMMLLFYQFSIFLATLVTLQMEMSVCLSMTPEFSSSATMSPTFLVFSECLGNHWMDG